jgi:thiamine-phosphate pyrophosphorylase
LKLKTSDFPAVRSLREARLYGIVDLGYVKPDAVVEMTRALVEGGVDILQLRAKNFPPAEVERLARQMHPVTREHGVPLVINDHPNVAAAVGSEGVHVGQDDLSVDETRRIVGASCFVGKSTHSLAQARAAMSEGADYIGFGPLFATGTKPDYTPIGLDDIAEVQRVATCPVFCIGGINPQTLPQVLSAGAKRVVIVSAFLLASDVRAMVREVKRVISES